MIVALCLPKYNLITEGLPEKEVQTRKLKTCWEGFIDDESGLCRMRCFACKQAFSATNPGQTHSHHAKPGHCWPAATVQLGESEGKDRRARKQLLAL